MSEKAHPVTIELIDHGDLMMSTRGVFVYFCVYLVFCVKVIDDCDLMMPTRGDTAERSRFLCVKSVKNVLTLEYSHPGLVRFPNPLASGSDIHGSWGT